MPGTAAVGAAATADAVAGAAGSAAKPRDVMASVKREARRGLFIKGRIKGLIKLRAGGEAFITDAKKHCE
jgi:hypothetical protein